MKRVLVVLLFVTVCFGFYGSAAKANTVISDSSGFSMSINPSLINFTTLIGSNPPSQTITTSGAGNWAAQVSGANTAWLQINGATGAYGIVGSTGITISANVAGLAVGTYIGSIVFQNLNDPSSSATATIPVTLTITSSTQTPPSTSYITPTTPTISGPSIVQANASSTFTFTGSNNGNTGFLTYVTNWGDGSTFVPQGQIASGVGYNVSHQWTTPGNYTITVIATSVSAGTVSQATYPIQVLASSMTTTPITQNPPITTSPLPVSTIGTDPDGTNVVGSDGTIYRIFGGSRLPYTSAGAFLTYGFNSFNDVVNANSADMQLPIATISSSQTGQVVPAFIAPRNGSLIDDNGTVYIITNGERQGFSSASVFTGLGYSFSNVMAGDTSFLVTLAPINSTAMRHPDGTVINRNGTIYAIINGTVYGFPNTSIFNSWGLSFPQVVNANSYDNQLPNGGTMNTRMANQLSI